ncbi:MAG: 4a-hydroxytetrahydrobiopterin dehydratase [Candidatus ainarchaeum sp.]|jgi:4a-hydroxytetrahydrobiopterin dehydratase|nr:4a-hydroxytetrahydrobiopterin dehydratase [Candidatus ainarchaeum sp.]MDD3086275.1 4a-hydroxytetrahydrobiopterin dehydratase [Candidatus ainarchaeum sp.]MDD4128844.1 4a-hydroxytetrahydrobiopterin dehydratase [Candidatus ainarchaeum sp.]MDD4468006.1 4a-hydroxytetrahydrobiopterin dehydratase [Candidatus ainarchaeum sp.]HPM86088.1 4a-hydroxytetrahydrobiopterin dehydratase [archaeon]
MDLNLMKCEQEEARLFLLEEEETRNLLRELFGWSIVDDFLVKSFPFESLNKALAFSNRVALIAQQENQFPKIVLNSSKAEFHLQTKLVEGLTKNDFIFAAKIDEQFKNIY